MNEFEIRIAALELAFIEVSVHIDSQSLSDVRATLSTGIGPEMTEDQRAVCNGAIRFIEDAIERRA